MSADQLAFPHPQYVEKSGMTMRQYYKASALQGVLSAHNMIDFPPNDKAAKWCAGYADAMLREDAEFTAKQLSK